jgi:hypothetical protein
LKEKTRGGKQKNKMNQKKKRRSVGLNRTLGKERRTLSRQLSITLNGGPAGNSERY